MDGRLCRLDFRNLVTAVRIIVAFNVCQGDGETIFQHACGLGAEGIVAKRRDKPYRSGRCPDWIKVRNPAAPAATRVIKKNWRGWKHEQHRRDCSAAS